MEGRFFGKDNIMKIKKIANVLIIAMCLTLLSGCGDKAESGEVSSIIGKYSKYVTLGEYKGVKYTPSHTEVTDEDIQNDINSLIYQGTTKDEVTDRAATWGDAVNIDYVGSIDGVEFDGGSTQGAGTEITLGSSGYIDNFDEQIVGHTPGDTFDVNVTFPDEYPNNPDLAGKPAVFKTTLNAVVISIEPEYNDELVASLTDCKTTKEFEDQKRAEHEEQNSATDANTDNENILQSVIDASTFKEFPEQEVQETIDEQIAYFQDLADSNGMDVETLMMYYGFQSSDDLQDYLKENVLDEFRRKMVVTTIAEVEGIKLDETEYKEKVDELLANYNYKDIAEFEANTMYKEEDIYLSLLEQKVVEFLKENAVAEEAEE